MGSALNAALFDDVDDSVDRAGLIAQSEVFRSRVSVLLSNGDSWRDVFKSSMGILLDVNQAENGRHVFARLAEKLNQDSVETELERVLTDFVDDIRDCEPFLMSNAFADPMRDVLSTQFKSKRKRRITELSIESVVEMLACGRGVAKGLNAAAMSMVGAAASGSAYDQTLMAGKSNPPVKRPTPVTMDDPLDKAEVVRTPTSSHDNLRGSAAASAELNPFATSLTPRTLRENGIPSRPRAQEYPFSSWLDLGADFDTVDGQQIFLLHDGGGRVECCILATGRPQEGCVRLVILSNEEVQSISGLSAHLNKKRRQYAPLPPYKSGRTSFLVFTDAEGNKIESDQTEASDLSHEQLGEILGDTFGEAPESAKLPCNGILTRFKPRQGAAITPHKITVHQYDFMYRQGLYLGEGDTLPEGAKTKGVIVFEVDGDVYGGQRFAFHVQALKDGGISWFYTMVEPHAQFES